MPIELGAHYVHPTWSQKLMTVEEFITSHIVLQAGDSTPIGYLAQHPLFEQVCILVSLNNIGCIIEGVKVHSA